MKKFGAVQIILWGAILIFIFGCGSDNQPASPRTDGGFTQSRNSGAIGGRVLWGIWRTEINPETYAV
ncbi:MAG: hypothetical protein ABIC40_04250, partial [bacterium]